MKTEKPKSKRLLIDLDAATISKVDAAARVNKRYRKQQVERIVERWAAAPGDLVRKTVEVDYDTETTPV